MPSEGMDEKFHPHFYADEITYQCLQLVLGNHRQLKRHPEHQIAFGMHMDLNLCYDTHLSRK